METCSWFYAANSKISWAIGILLPYLTSTPGAIFVFWRTDNSLGSPWLTDEPAGYLR